MAGKGGVTDEWMVPYYTGRSSFDRWNNGRGVPYGTAQNEAEFCPGNGNTDFLAGLDRNLLVQRAGTAAGISVPVNVTDSFIRRAGLCICRNGLNTVADRIGLRI